MICLELAPGLGYWGRKVLISTRCVAKLGGRAEAWKGADYMYLLYERC
jgi:hypothetical protein